MAQLGGRRSEDLEVPGSIPGLKFSGMQFACVVEGPNLLQLLVRCRTVAGIARELFFGA
jgi:hypothetical protein